VEGFKGKNIKDVKKVIDADLQQKRAKKKNREETVEKVQDKKRDFLNLMRPPYYWNFFEDSDEKTPHVLRHDANP